jgi:hypothetical protein
MYDLESVVYVTVLEYSSFGKTEEMSNTQGMLPAQVVTYGHRCFRQGVPEALGYFLCRHRGQEVSRTAHQINNSETVSKRPPAYMGSSQHQAQSEFTLKSGHVASGM